MKPLSLVVCAALSFGPSSGAEGKPLKVYILAGQSNMEGHAKVETFDYIGDDPATAPLLKMMRGADGKPAVCDGAWISYLTGSGENNGEGVGKLETESGEQELVEDLGLYEIPTLTINFRTLGRKVKVLPRGSQVVGGIFARADGREDRLVGASGRVDLVCGAGRVTLLRFIGDDGKELPQPSRRGSLRLLSIREPP